MMIFRECVVDTVPQHALWFTFGQVGIQSTRRGAGQTEKDEKTDALFEQLQTGAERQCGKSRDTVSY